MDILANQVSFLCVWNRRKQLRFFNMHKWTLHLVQYTLDKLVQPSILHVVRDDFWSCSGQWSIRSNRKLESGRTSRFVSFSTIISVTISSSIRWMRREASPYLKHRKIAFIHLYFLLELDLFFQPTHMNRVQPMWNMGANPPSQNWQPLPGWVYDWTLDGMHQTLLW